MDRFLNMIYYWLVDKLESQEDLDKLNLKLWQPPVGEAAEEQSPWSAEAETRAFSAFSAQVTGKTREGAQLPREPDPGASG